MRGRIALQAEADEQANGQGRSKEQGSPDVRGCFGHGVEVKNLF